MTQSTTSRISTLLTAATLPIAFSVLSCHGHKNSNHVQPRTLVSVAVTPTNPTLEAGTAGQFSATGSWSDGTNSDLTALADWSTADPAVATVSAGPESFGLVSGLALGTTLITATYTGISGSTTLTVSAAGLVAIEVTPTNPQIALGTSAQFAATGRFTDGTTQDLTAQVAWESSSTAATISNDPGSAGLAHSAGLGDTTIRATLGSTSGSTTLSVSAAVLVSVEVTPTDPSIALGTQQQFAATGTFTDGTIQDLTAEVVWASSAATAEVSNGVGSQGLAQSIAVGSASISATHSGISGSTTLSITSATLVSIGVTPANAQIALGTSQAFQATGTFTDGTTQDLTAAVSWASSEAAVASISNSAGSNGLASSIGVGSTTISAELEGISGATTFGVTDAALVAVEVTPSHPSAALGTTLSFTATGTYTDSSTQDLTNAVTWTTSDAAVATVSNAEGSRGLATTVSVGSTEITAALGERSGSTTFGVSAATLVAIAVSPDTATLALGTSQAFTAQGVLTDGTKQDLTEQVTWNSSNASIATVSNADGSHGLVTSVAIGSIALTASFEGVSGSVTVDVSNAQLVAIDVTPSHPSAALGTQVAFTATGTYTDNSTQDLTDAVTWTTSDAAVAAVSNAEGSRGLATTLSVGSAVITAAFGEMSGSTSLVVSPAAVVAIVVSPDTATLAMGTSQAFTAQGVLTDDTKQDLTDQVTWSSSDASIATVSNADGSRGLATAVAVGSITLTAGFAGVSGSVTVEVSNAALVAIDVTPSHPSAALGTQVAFTATGTYTDNSTRDLSTEVTWSSSAPAIATISNALGSQGLAAGVGVGTATITAALGERSGSTALDVSPAAVVAILVSPEAATLALGTSRAFTAQGVFTDDTRQDLTEQVTWSSSNAAIAAVSNADGSRGLATAVGIGSITLTARFAGVSGSATLGVTDAELVAIDVAPSHPSAALGTKLAFTATGTYTDHSTQELSTQVTWSSSAPAIATISNALGSQGLATMVSVGSAEITAALGGRSGSTALDVLPAAVVAIAVSPDAATLALGTTQPFKAQGVLSDGTRQDLTDQVTWSSSNSAIATVSNAGGSRGLATAVGVGSVTLTAAFAGVSGSAAVDVTAATLDSIDIEPFLFSIAKGTQVSFSAIGNYSDGSSQDLTTQVTWSSSAPAVATISNALGSQGLATGVGVGTATINASFAGVVESLPLDVTAAQLVSLELTPANPSLHLGTGCAMHATGHFSDASTQDLTRFATWSSSNSAVATFSSAPGSEGLVQTVGAGSATLGAAYSGKSASTNLTVSAATLVSLAVSPASTSLPAGYSRALQAIGTYSDGSTQNLNSQVYWTSSNPAIAKISNSAGTEGRVTGTALGSVTLSATASIGSGTASLTVTNESLNSIVVEPANVQLAVGEHLQMTATGHFSGGSVLDVTDQVKWKVTPHKNASVTNLASKGLVTARRTGHATIRAGNGYATGTASLTVTQ